MTLGDLIILLAVVAAGIGACLFAMGYYCGQEDTADPRRWERGQHPYAGPLPDGGDFDDYLDAVLLDILHPGVTEKLASTGELALLYDRDYPEYGTARGESTGPQEMIA
jgi:hypothetical protein